MAMAPSSHFASTRWSVVLAAGRGGDSGPVREALASLCETYWYPVYAFIRRRGHDADAAADLAQGFFTRLLEKGFLAGARQERGRFRSYLLGAVRHYLANERDRALAARRGGRTAIVSLDRDAGEDRYRREPADSLTPEKQFERRWALTMLERVLQSLAREYAETGRAVHFDRLKAFLTDPAEPGAYRQAARDLRMTEGAVRVAAHRLRRRYRDLLREEVSQTVARPGDVEAELRHLLEAVSG